MHEPRYSTLVALGVGGAVLYCAAAAARVFGRDIDRLPAPTTLELVVWFLASAALLVFNAIAWALAAGEESAEYADRPRKLACSPTRNTRRAASINALVSVVSTLAAALALARAINLDEAFAVPLAFVWLEALGYALSRFAYRPHPRRPPPPSFAIDEEGAWVVS